jgi:hypothetical protein
MKTEEILAKLSGTFVDVPTVSAIMGVRPNTVIRLIHAGKIKGVDLAKDGSQRAIWRIHSDSVLKVLGLDEVRNEEAVR